MKRQGERLAVVRLRAFLYPLRPARHALWIVGRLTSARRRIKPCIGNSKPMGALVFVCRSLAVFYGFTGMFQEFTIVHWASPTLTLSHSIETQRARISTVPHIR